MEPKTRGLLDSIINSNLTFNFAPYVNHESKNNLPYDVKKVIMRDGKVVVVLRNGSKGVSNCSYNDEYDPYVGFCIAYYKAKNNKNFELKKTLKGCVENAKKKGYKQAILNG